MKASGRDARAVVVGAAGVVLILGYMFVFAPTMDRWRLATDGIGTAEERIELLDRLAQRADLAEERKVQLAPLFLAGRDIEAWEAYLPLLIDQLEHMTSFDAVEVQRYDPVRARPTDNYGVCALTILLRCGVADLQDLLYDIEQGEPLLTVDRLHIAPDKREPGTLRVQLVVSVYIVQEELLGDAGAVG